MERGGWHSRGDQCADCVHVGALVAYYSSDSIESIDGRPGVRHRPSFERVRVLVRDDLLRSMLAMSDKVGSR